MDCCLTTVELHGLLQEEGLLPPPVPAAGAHLPQTADGGGMAAAGDTSALLLPPSTTTLFNHHHHQQQQQQHYNDVNGVGGEGSCEMDIDQQPADSVVSVQQPTAGLPPPSAGLDLLSPDRQLWGLPGGSGGWMDFVVR